MRLLCTDPYISEQLYVHEVAGVMSADWRESGSSRRVCWTTAARYWETIRYDRVHLSVTWVSTVGKQVARRQIHGARHSIDRFVAAGLKQGETAAVECRTVPSALILHGHLSSSGVRDIYGRRVHGVRDGARGVHLEATALWHTHA